jgi:hypothetical protein
MTSYSALILRRRDQPVTNSRFVLVDATGKCLVSNDGDVAERLKAAVWRPCSRRINETADHDSLSSAGPCLRSLSP